MLVLELSFGGNYLPEEDRLLFTDTENLKAHFDVENGLLKIFALPSGEGVDIALFQEAVRGIRYRNLNTDNPKARQVQLALKVTDPSGTESQTIQKTLEIIPVNDPPIVSSPNTATEDASSRQNVRIFSPVSIEEPEGQQIDGAIIEIASGFVPGYDELGFRGNDRGLSVSISERVVSISGSADPDTYARLIERVVFNTNTFILNRQDGLRLVSLTVLDTEGNQSRALNKFLVIQPLFSDRINSPPYIKPASVETDENEPFSFEDEIFGDVYTDPEEDDLSGIQIVSRPEHGELFLDDELINNQFILAGNTIPAQDIEDLRYEPNPFYFGEDSFTWQATDGESFTANPALLNINVNPVNQPPQLQGPAVLQTQEDTPLTFSLTVSDTESGKLTAELSVEQGLISLPPLILEEPLFAISSGASGEQSLTAEGPKAHIAFALSSLNYRPGADFFGEDQLEVKVSDGQADANTTIPIVVTEVNDGPQLKQLETETLDYREGSPAISISTQLEVNDPENDLIEGASLFFSSGFVAGKDTLVYEEQNGITATFTDSTLSLTGAADAAAYQQALRKVSYLNSGDQFMITEKTLSLQVRDTAGATGPTYERDINIIPVNDPPQLSGLEETPLRYVEDREAVTISGTLVTSDPDDSMLSLAEIRVSTGYTRGEDELLFEDTNLISSTFDAAEGLLSLSGEATLQAYQQAIRNVRYRNTASAIDTEKERALSIRVRDAKLFSNFVIRPLEVIVNQPPLVSDFALTSDEDEAITFSAGDFPFSDTDNFPSGGEATRFAITRLPEQGFLILEEDTLKPEDIQAGINGFEIEAERIGELSYLPEADYFGEDTFSWNAFDGAEYATEDATAALQIQAIADAPQLSPLLVSTQEDQAYTFSAEQSRAAYTDADGDTLRQLIIDEVPDRGRLLLNGNINVPTGTRISLGELDQLTFRPNANFFGTDRFSWSAEDASGSVSEAAEVEVQVIAVNDAPVVSSFTRATEEGESYRFSPEDFTGSYLDIENDPLSAIVIVSLPASGSLLLGETAISAGDTIARADLSMLMYQPSQASELSGFAWQASDGELLSDTARVRMIIGEGITSFSISTEEDSAYRMDAALFINNYGNPDGLLQRVRIARLPIQGTLSLSGAAVSAGQEIGVDALSELVYLPDANYNGMDSLAWSASAGTTFTEPAQLKINISAVNDVPVLSGPRQLLLTAGEASESFSLLITDVDSDADSLSLNARSSDQSIIPDENILLSGEGSERSLQLSPTENTSGEVMISLLAGDGQSVSQYELAVIVQPYAIAVNLPALTEACLDRTNELAVSPEGGTPPYSLQADCDQPACDISYLEGQLSFTAQADTRFFITFTDANGVVSRSDTLLAEVIDCSELPLEIPTGFTPDGDGINDVWEIGNIAFYENIRVEVFNRYGASLFAADNYQQPWDGAYENRILPAGTYYYLISINGGEQTYSGTLSILR